MKYRPDIDGLRAFAVVSVALGHAKVPGLAGGYVGVDVFFVISGFLITSVLLREIDRECFSLVGFYERRIRRIFPALMVVLLGCLAAGVFWLSMHHQAEMSRSILSALAFASNLYFWQGTGYFDGGSQTLPLLHTWSLAVEEQFYLLFPVLLFAAKKSSRSRLIAIVVVISVSSLAFAIIGAQRFHSFAFFGAPSRAWELMLGSLLALGCVPTLRRRAVAEVLAWVGLAMLVASVSLLDERTPFPSYYALLPCLGTVFVIHAGQLVDGEDLRASKTWVTRLLSTRPLVGIGLISYSLYLWHWPLLIFGGHFEQGLLSLPTKLALLGVATLLAYLSWRFVESPFRIKSGHFSRRQIFFMGALSMLVVAGLSLPSIIDDPLRSIDEELAKTEILDNPEAESRRLETYANEINPRRRFTMSSPGRVFDPVHAPLFGADVPPRYALWGDSHADALVFVLGEYLERRGDSLKAYIYSGNPPLLDYGQDVDPDSAAWSARVFDEITRSPTIEVVFVVARWTLHVHGYAHGLGREDARDEYWKTVTADGQVIEWGPSLEAHFRKQLTATIEGLRAAGKRVVLIYPTPELGERVPATLAALVRRGRDRSEFSVSEAYFYERQAFALETLDALTYGETLMAVKPHERLFVDHQTLLYKDGRVLFADDNHLSLSGARYIISLFDQTLLAPSG